MRSVADLPEVPDATFIAVNASATIEAVRALEARGASGAVLYAAGFGELGERGRATDAALADAAGDMAIVGPNSNGLLNSLSKLALWPTNDHQPLSMRSGAAVVAQSGGVARLVLREQRGVQPAVVISSGNQTLLDVADVLEVLLDDERITAIGLFVEGVGDVAAVSRIYEHAKGRAPVVIMKTGRSRLGVEMAVTHTGSLAGDDEFFDALCTRLGFVRVESLTGFVETLKAFDRLGTLRGRRMAVLSASGATRALFADACESRGILLPELSSRTAERLRPQLPDFAHVSNPLDYNAAYTGSVGLTFENEPALFECFRTVLSEGFDVAVMHAESTDVGEAGSPVLRAWRDAVRATGTPGALVTLMPENMSATAHKFCRENGLASLQGLLDALDAIEAVMDHGSTSPPPPDELALPSPVAPAVAPEVLDEGEAKDALEAYGLRIFPKRRLASADGIVEAARELRFPVALKAVSGDIPHKSRVGAMAVGLVDENALVRAVRSVEAAVAAAGVTPRAYLVEEMIRLPKTEVLVGVKSSPIYGHGLVLGAGGVDVEELDDTSVVLIPASAGQIRAGLSKLRVRRAMSERMILSLIDVALAISRYAVSVRGDLVSMEINPLILTSDGEAVGADALIVRSRR